MVVASAVALAEAVPDASLRPGGLHARSAARRSTSARWRHLLVEAGYERVDQVEERGQFAVRGGILDVFGATEDRAARLELFGDEIESIRWFSTFTQRSLGEAERVELSPAAELASEHRELAELALEDDAERPDLAELLPLESFRAVLDLIPDGDGDGRRRRRGDRDGAPRPLGRRHDGDARRRRAPPLRRRRRAARRACLARRSIGSPRLPVGRPEQSGLSFRAQAPTSAARSIGEAESQLERELRSGNRVVVAFEHRGEAERARYNLNRLDAPLPG